MSKLKDWNHTLVGKHTIELNGETVDLIIEKAIAQGDDYVGPAIEGFLVFPEITSPSCKDPLAAEMDKLKDLPPEPIAD